MAQVCVHCGYTKPEGVQLDLSFCGAQRKSRTYHEFGTKLQYLQNKVQTLEKKLENARLEVQREVSKTKLTQEVKLGVDSIGLSELPTEDF